MNWDQYFLNICDAVSSKSPCLSRNIGAIIVRDHSIVSTGYNGPARGYPHCAGESSYVVDHDIMTDPSIWLGPGKIISVKEYNKISVTHPICPRHAKGYKSGEGLHECPAAHAEANAIANAARLGVSVRGDTMYMNTKEVSCKDCMILIVNSGIHELVTLECATYHKMSFDIAKYGKVNLRRFNL